MQTNEGERGRCLTCGFLAKRTAVQDGSKSLPIYHEISRTERESGVELRAGYVRPLGDAFALGGVGVSVKLACIRGAAELSRETPNEALRRVRHCGSWYPYMPGFSPQQHLQDFRMQELERLRTQTEEARERDRREFEERLSARNEELQRTLALRNEQIQIQRDESQIAYNKLIKRITLLGVIFAAIQVVTGILTDEVKAAIMSWLRRLFH